ncbi:hypothetical protein PUN28_014895 [Cardiocondyla obscurior]|uniref:Gustatory receptor n=3 Tax=Cardiocondyla obscurior TaxID=286306 RepID=A0AAW2F217_9HYME
MDENSHCNDVPSSVENLFFTDAKINSFVENKKSVDTEKVSEQKMMKKSSESHQDSFWLLKSLIIFFKIIGLATFAHRVVTRKKKLSYTFQYSECGIVYNVALSSLMIGSNYFSIPFRLYGDYENRSNLTVSIEVLQTVLGTLVICAILLAYSIDQRSLVRLANQLIEIEHEINRLCCMYRPLRRQRVLCNLAVVCVLNVCLIIVLLITENLAWGAGPISWLSDILPTFHVGWMLIQYFMLVTIIQANFAYVNQAIQNLTRVSTPDLRPQSLYQTRRVVVSNSTVHQLLQLRDMHCHLCEISEDISNFYSLPVLFGITFLFLTLIYNGYFFISPLLTADEMLEYKALINTIIWLLTLIYPISLLTNIITKILKEIGKTGSMLHNLLSYAIGKETKSELKQFSLQLLHRKIQFTANGYFVLDNSFLHSLIGTVVTYLVILIQFQMGSSHSSRLHHNCTKEN